MICIFLPPRYVDRSEWVAVNRGHIMKKSLIHKNFFFALLTVCCLQFSHDALAEDAASASTAGCSENSDPYKNYACLDSYLGENVAERFWNYYKLEMGHASAPV